MNKQEAIKRVEQMGEYERFVDEPVSKKSVLNIIYQIQEPRPKSTNLAFDLIVLSGPIESLKADLEFIQAFYDEDSIEDKENAEQLIDSYKHAIELLTNSEVK